MSNYYLKLRNSNKPKHEQKLFALSYLYGFCRAELRHHGRAEFALSTIREEFRQFEEAFPWGETYDAAAFLVTDNEGPGAELTRLDPNAALGAVERDRCEKIGKGEE